MEGDQKHAPRIPPTRLIRYMLEDDGGPLRGGFRRSLDVAVQIARARHARVVKLTYRLDRRATEVIEDNT